MKRPGRADLKEINKILYSPLQYLDLYSRPKIPKAGSWSDWGSWQPQGSDKMTRTRVCDSPAPMFGGKFEGEAEEIGLD